MVAELDPKREAAEALAILLDSAWSFSRHCKRLSPAAIRLLVRRKATHAMHVYLSLAVDADAKDAALAKSWARAIQGMADLETINHFTAKPKRDKFRALAKNKHLLPAIQGAAARGEHVTIDMLAVLVADGSAESFDALIPNLEPRDDRRVDWLRRLRVHAKSTPALNALFAELDVDAAKLGARGQGIATLIGLPDAKNFWFDARISMHVSSGYIAPITVAVKIDTRKASWFDVWVMSTEYKTTHFTHQKIVADDLGLGRCAAADVPAYLAKVAKKLRITWDPPYISSSVRGAKRQLIANWLVPA